MWQEDAWGLLSVTAGPGMSGRVAEPVTGFQPPSSPAGLPSLPEMQGGEDTSASGVVESTAEGSAEGLGAAPPKPWDVAANGQEASALL